MDEWKNMDALSLMAKHGALDLPGGINTSDSEIDAIANSIGPEEPEYESMSIDGDYDIPEENRTGLSHHQHRGLPPARVIDAGSDAERMVQQYMGQNGGVIIPDGTSYLDYMQNMQSDQGGEKKVIVGELERNKGKIILG